MLRRMTLAAAVLALAGPALADDTCLTDVQGAQCDLFLDRYRADDVPVGTTDVWASDEFVVERDETLRPDSALDVPGGKEVLYWDGDSAMVVPEETGPRLEIADW